MQLPVLHKQGTLAAFVFGCLGWLSGEFPLLPQIVREIPHSQDGTRLHLVHSKYTRGLVQKMGGSQTVTWAVVDVTR